MRLSETGLCLDCGRNWNRCKCVEPSESSFNDLLSCPWCGVPPSAGGDFGNWWKGCINEDCPVKPITGHHESVGAANRAWAIKAT